MTVRFFREGDGRTVRGVGEERKKEKEKQKTDTESHRTTLHHITPHTHLPFLPPSVVFLLIPDKLLIAFGHPFFPVSDLSPFDGGGPQPRFWRGCQTNGHHVSGRQQARNVPKIAGKELMFDQPGLDAGTHVSVCVVACISP